MAIKLDESATSVVVYCTDCGHWRAFAWTMEEGHKAAERHESLVHPESFQASKAADKWRARNIRHAAESSIVEVGAVDSRHGNPRPPRTRTQHARAALVVDEARNL